MDVVVVWIVAVIVWGAASGAWMVFGRLVAKSRANKDPLEDAIDTSRKWRKELMADWDRQFRKLSGEPGPGSVVVTKSIEDPWQSLIEKLHYELAVTKAQMGSVTDGDMTWTPPTPPAEYWLDGSKAIPYRGYVNHITGQVTKLPGHGTLASYQHRACRCEECKRVYLDTMSNLGYPESIYGSPFGIAEMQPPTSTELAIRA